MTRRSIAVIICCAAVLLVAGGLFASNMGFKLNKQLNFTGTATGINSLSLPFNRQIGIDNAKNLLDDIKNTGSPTNAVAGVARYNPATNSPVFYTGAPADIAFNLSKAEGYLVQMTQNATYIVVGSDDPAFVVTFLGTGASATGINLYSLPYHTTTTNAEQLRNELRATGAPVNNVGAVGNYNTATNSPVFYTGAPADVAFPLVAGNAYFVQVSGASNVTYSPSHY
jgi:hypothetical protein